jgi:hypothetical protein
VVEGERISPRIIIAKGNIQKLFWKTKGGKTIAATETLFTTEDEFEP